MIRLMVSGVFVGSETRALRAGMACEAGDSAVVSRVRVLSGFRSGGSGCGLVTVCDSGAALEADSVEVTTGSAGGISNSVCLGFEGSGFATLSGVGMAAGLVSVKTSR